jgi:ribosomal protein L40E
METKICPKCNTENPIAANFCRTCGTKLSSSFFNRVRYKSKTYLLPQVADNCVKEFTLEKFNHIAFKPISVVPITFVSKVAIVIEVILCLIAFILWTQIGLGEVGGSDSDWSIFLLTTLLVSLGVVALSRHIVVSGYHKFIFNHNATFIEDKFVDTLKRVAHKGKLGLFDTRSKSVRLRSVYDSITEFDKEHILIEQNGKKGIYSIAQKRIIVPVSFDSISPFSNSVCSAILNGTTTHYDVKGNRLL